MNYRGMSLVEVLVASVIGGVIILGSAKSLMFSIQSGGVARSILTETDLKLTLDKVLTDEDSCKKSLAPSKITGDDNNKGIGEVTSLSLKLEGGQDEEVIEEVIKKGDFKRDIEVIKMELLGKTTEDATTAVVRTFVAYYKKKNLGDLNTVAGGTCTEADTSGCFVKRCRVQYQVGSTPATDPPAVCKALDCNALQVIQAGVSPYKCPWGEVWDLDKEKCDPRDKPVASDYIDSTKMMIETGTNGDKTSDNCVKNKVLDSDSGKCVCKGEFVLAVDGRCIPKRVKTWPPPCLVSINVSDGGSEVDNKRLKYFCSQKYMGDRFCYITFQNDPFRNNPTRIKRTIYKRFYNRETGQVRCDSFEQHNGHCGYSTNNPFVCITSDSSSTTRNIQIKGSGKRVFRFDLYEKPKPADLDAPIYAFVYYPELPRDWFDNATK